LAGTVLGGGELMREPCVCGRSAGSHRSGDCFLKRAAARINGGGEEEEDEDEEEDEGERG
jgi:hypothetical protein